MDKTETKACTAGFAMLDITPPLGTYMAGQFYPRHVKGVLDPMYVRAVAFGEGEKSAVLLVLDMVNMSGQAGSVWPGQIAEKLGLAEAAVFVCCTHSHTTSCVSENADPQYVAWLFRRLCDAAQMALDDRRPILDVRWAETQTHGMTFVRRYRMKDGSVINNPIHKTPEDIAKIAGPVSRPDESLRLVRILRQDAPELVFVNFQTHPDCVGGECVSADYPGAVCRRVEEAVPGSRCVYLDGAQGQLTIIDHMQLPKRPKNHAAAMAYGVELADCALSVYDSAVSTGRDGLGFAKQYAHVPTKRGLLDVEESRRIVARYKEGGLAAIDPSTKIAAPIVAEAQAACWLEERGADALDLPVTVLAVCGLALVGIPGEPFNEVGTDVRAASEFPVTCVCCLTNGSFGYFPMAKDFADGAYEARGCKLRKGVSEQLEQTALALLRAL